MIRTCSRCGTKNRIPLARAADTGRCGSCRAALPPPATPLEVSTAEFDTIIGSATVPVLVDFWAEWCGPCRMAAPEVSKVAERWSGRALVLKVNTDANPQLASRYRIQGIPNFAVFRGGELVFQQAGLVNATAMEGWLNAA